eukprot:EC690538.1.p1 GENE.EC690538.1~~EC690538.1.p1  ORF type:complete len:156 (-),score=40.53 EC690538.1:85-552(-)
MERVVTQPLSLARGDHTHIHTHTPAPHTHTHTHTQHTYSTHTYAHTHTRSLSLSLWPSLTQTHRRERHLRDVVVRQLHVVLQRGFLQVGSLCVVQLQLLVLDDDHAEGGARLLPEGGEPLVKVRGSGNAGGGTHCKAGNSGSCNSNDNNNNTPPQ